MVTGDEYAGDISIGDAWSVLERDPWAQLVDVRTIAEWAFVGVPDVSSLGRETLCVEWQVYPRMDLNPDFVPALREKLRGAHADEDTPLLFLCRSGARSRAAAIAMAEAGYTKSYNILGGFEGELDSERHRGRLSGWKAAGLPWRQS